MAILFEWYENPVAPNQSQEETKLHARITLNGKTGTDRLRRKSQERCSLTETDVSAVLDALSHAMGEELAEGRQVHLDGIGYFHPTLTCTEEIKEDTKRKNTKVRLKGIKFRPNTHIGGAIGIDDLFRDGYKAIFVGTGVWKPNALHIKGETLGHVHFGINYLNNPDSYCLGERVIVIGAGNAAMDVARTAIRKGVRYLTCFSITKKVAASHHEFSYAQLEGVQFEYNKAPVEITDEGVIFKDMAEDEEGRLTEIPGSETLYPADSVIISISQGPQNRIVNTTEGLAADAKGLLVADETGHTTRPGIFASGDVVNGARTVVEAVAHSKIVAESMHQYMQSLKQTEEAPD